VHQRFAQVPTGIVLLHVPSDCLLHQPADCMFTVLLQVIVRAAAPVTAEEVAQKPGAHVNAQGLLDVAVCTSGCQSWVIQGC
jgi:hypothetical protein